ncbi:MAG: nucleoside hydrolase [Clostridia bacterium]|nr:nucleoside hydrolase [Clostridia bacterium]
MNANQYLENLSVPQGKIDVVIDTDAYNEIDDQFAIAYLLRNSEKLNTVAIYAAPFSFPHISPEEGMEASYKEILNLLSLSGVELPVYRGSTRYLESESAPVISEAAEHLASLANNYSPEKPLYVVAIGAITNVASAILLNPKIKENCVIIWLGGHSHEMEITDEYNMKQDIAAARVVMSSGAPFIQLPCAGVVSGFAISESELERFFSGHGPLADYLARHSLEEMKEHRGLPWTRVIWDVTAVAWLLNEDDRFMLSRVMPTYLPDYTNHYESAPIDTESRYVYFIRRDALMRDLIDKVCD